MSRLWARFSGLFTSRKFIGVDKVGNKYFSRTEEIDGIVKEKRWVVFKGQEEDPTSIPVEWICWLNGQRKRAPTPEELAELEARRERVKLNVALLKKEEEEKKAREGSRPKIISSKVEGPDLKSFVQHFPADSKGEKLEDDRGQANESRVEEPNPKPKPEAEDIADQPLPISTEPTGSGASFRPGTWRPPS